MKFEVGMVLSTVDCFNGPGKCKVTVLAVLEVLHPVYISFLPLGFLKSLISAGILIRIRPRMTHTLGERGPILFGPGCVV